MKIQYMSDLHLEFADNINFIRESDIPVTGDVLVLAGDSFLLNNTTTPKNKFWDWTSDHYRQVLMIPGNHEYYGNHDVMTRGLQWKWMIRENVGMYQNQVVRIDDTDFILSTMWSLVPPTDSYHVRQGLNDFHQTLYDGHRMTVEEYNQMHLFSLDFIKKSVMGSSAKHIVVVTHHLPTLKVVAAQHQGSILNSAFATELGNFIADSRIDYWIYGHSHTNIDTTVGNTHIVCNQLGYVFNYEYLQNGFDFGKHIEL